MLERITGLPTGIDGVKAIGKVSKADYETVLEPLLDGARRSGHRLRLLYDLGPDFKGFSRSAAWEDVKVALRFMRLFDGCAVVSDVGWIRESVRLVGFTTPCPLKVFANHEGDQAIAWLRSLNFAGPAAVSHHLLEKTGVIVIEAKTALRTQDFDALTITADAWIRAHGQLQGLVIHAREFPGWENLGSLLRHVRFARSHLRKVKRIGLVTDSKLATWAPIAAEHFMKADVRAFEYGDLEAAIAWAGGSSGQASKPAAVGRCAPSARATPSAVR